MATPESIYENRRAFLKGLGFAGLGAVGLLRGGTVPVISGDAFAKEGDLSMCIPKSPTSGLYPAKRNSAFTLDRAITKEAIAAQYNNFYEFSLKKDVWRYIERFETRPWQVEVAGEVEHSKIFDIDDLVRKMPLEERLYRHRCVEAFP